MSFRSNDQRRYGNVPPVQYPVSGPIPSQVAAERRSSFNTGDDAQYYARQLHRRPIPLDGNDNPQEPSRDELFLPSSTSTSAHRTALPFASGSLSSRQHNQFAVQPSAPNVPTAYDPNQLPRPMSELRTSQSSHAPRLAQIHSQHANESSGMATHNVPPRIDYAPAAYNPAAYANTNAHSRQHPSHHYGYEQSHLSSASASQTLYSPLPDSRQNTVTSFPNQSPLLSPALRSPQPASPSATTWYNAHASSISYSPARYSSQYRSDMHASTQDRETPPPPPHFVAPFPTAAPTRMPVGPNYHSDDYSSYYNHSPRSDPHSSLSNSPLAPLHNLQRHPTNAPLPSRPGEDPAESNVEANAERAMIGIRNGDELTTDRVLQEIKQQIRENSPRTHPEPLTFYDPSVYQSLSHDHGADSGTDDRASSSHTFYDNNDDSGSDPDDDPEGTAGALAMAQDELNDGRFNSATFNPTGEAPQALNRMGLPYPDEQQDSCSADDEMEHAFDLGMLSGGDAVNLTYGTDTFGLADPSSLSGRSPLQALQEFSRYSQHYVDAPTINAETDYSGTGGLQAPTGPRLSFDEMREERVSVHSRRSGTDSPAKDEYLELLYHPELADRPLPALPLTPEVEESKHHGCSLQAHQPERSISLSGLSNTPQVQAPVRSRTDAAEERRKLARQQHMIPQHGSLTADLVDAPSSTVTGAYDSITLPSGRKKKLIPSKLTASDFNKCTEPWALSQVEAWVRLMGEGESDLRVKTVEDAITLLFTAKVPTMNVADAEALSSQIVQLMLGSEALLPEEEWVKFGERHISGVLWQLTGRGCYAVRLHDPEIPGRCYSSCCTRTLKKVYLDELLAESAKGASWHEHYCLTKQDWEAKPKKEVDRQNILHEIVTGEDNYIKQLEILGRLYRDDFRARDPPIIHPEKQDSFCKAVFGRLDTVMHINKEHLYAQLKYRQNEQGPWIIGFSDIFREWIRKAKNDYVAYATGYPRATYVVRKEANRNILFKKFLEDRQKHKSSQKQDWTHYLIAPLQRLQRYILLLKSVEDKMIGDSDEKTNLRKAIDEIKAVTQECDAKVAETGKRVQMMELDKMLVLRKSFQAVLNLDQLGRVLIMEGELQRMGSKGMSWVDTHALLFDHYFILAKMHVRREGKGEKRYDVSREPIPMPLLFLESVDDEPVTKQKTITAPLGRTSAANTSSSTQLNRLASNGSGRPGLEHAGTGSSLSIPASATSIEAEGKILYPFKVKHLGHEVYTLYASSARDRSQWCQHISEAKERHAAALYSQNAEPFRLRVLAYASFQYDAGSPYARAPGVPSKKTPLDRAIKDLEKIIGPAQGIAPVCRAQVNCATGFSAFGRSVIAIGTDYGIYVADPLDPRGWKRTVHAARITQIAVLEEFSVCLALTDKSLISYPLDVVAPSSDIAPLGQDGAKRAPHRLANNVTYFATARMKDRMLVYYKRKEGLHTSFKVLEPILHKGTEKRSCVFGGRRLAASSTDIFRDFDEFFFPTECYSLSLFQTYIAVATAKGIEMLTLDKKQPMSIPDLKGPSIGLIAGRIRDQRPLGMFRLNESEFILTYEDCAVYVDKHGDVSRALIMEYTGKQKKVRGATMYGQNLLLFADDYVEIRDADGGRLRQIIAGRDVRVLDYGIRGPTGGNAAHSQQTYGQTRRLQTAGETSKGTVKIAMFHPELPGRQLVLELLLNDGHSD